MLRSAVEAHGVAYVPGAAFYAGTPERTRLRLSFASASVEQIGEGVRRLARCIRLTARGGIGSHQRRGAIAMTASSLLQGSIVASLTG